LTRRVRTFEPDGQFLNPIAVSGDRRLGAARWEKALWIGVCSFGDGEPALSAFLFTPIHHRVSADAANNQGVGVIMRIKRVLFLAFGAIAIGLGAVVVYVTCPPIVPPYVSLESTRRSPKAVRRLVLFGQGLTAVPEEIRGLTNLSALVLTGNEIAHLPDWLVENPKIAALSLTNDSLVQFPTELTRMTGLRFLDLDFNAIPELPPEIGRMTALWSLDLDDNRLTGLPREIGQLKELKELSIAGNCLKALPPEIGNLESLKVLYLRNNQLTALPAEMCRLKALRELWLERNCLSTSAQEEIRRMLPNAGWRFTVKNLKPSISTRCLPNSKKCKLPAWRNIPR